MGFISTLVHVYSVLVLLFLKSNVKTRASVRSLVIGKSLR